MTWLLWIGGGATALVAIIAAGREIKKLVSTMVEGFSKAVESAMADREGAQDRQLQQIAHELKTNGGTSVKDLVIQTARNVAALTEQVAGFEEYTHRANHDLRNKYAAVRGLMQILHGDELPSDVIDRLEVIMADGTLRIVTTDGDQVFTERRQWDHGPPEGSERRGQDD